MIVIINYGSKGSKVLFIKIFEYGLEPKLVALML